MSWESPGSAAGGHSSLQSKRSTVAPLYLELGQYPWRKKKQGGGGGRGGNIGESNFAHGCLWQGTSQLGLQDCEGCSVRLGIVGIAAHMLENECCIVGRSRMLPSPHMLTPHWPGNFSSQLCDAVLGQSLCFYSPVSPKQDKITILKPWKAAQDRQHMLDK